MVQFSQKASLITIHTGSNYGSVLQTIATAIILNRHDIDVTVVNYIPPRCTYKYILRQMVGAEKGKHNILKRIKKVLAGVLKIFNLWKINKIFLGTIEKYCSLSAPIYYEDSFAIKCPKADLYITGSDQVWNTYYNGGIDKHYFFDGITGRKVAMASSIGMDTLNDEEKRVYYECLSNYEAISVREYKAVEILHDIGISSIQVLDPTLKLTKDDWHSFFSLKRIIECRYLLIYIPYNTINESEIKMFAKMVACEQGLKILLLSNCAKNDDCDINVLNNIGPKDFLSLMYYADFVITNSFHGTAFSINLNRNFVVFMPARYTSRIDSLLELCNLKERIVRNSKDHSIANKKINYNIVNAILDKERKKFDDFISNL